jgi:rubrerythrin
MVSKALDQMLSDILERHIRAESETMGEYAELAERMRVPMVDMLMRLVADDEVRHHKLLERLAASVGDNQYWKQKAEPLPSATVAKDSSPEVASLVRRMVEGEAASARAFRGLARKHKDERQGLFALLLEVMAMDSKKHEHILRFISGRLGA